MNVALIVSTLAAVGGGLAMLWLSRALNRRPGARTSRPSSRIAILMTHVSEVLQANRAAVRERPDPA